MLKNYGVSRIVPARELSLKEIESIYRETGLEIECFVHGALCYSYSGMCLLSSLIGARSGNRGRCAQPCRLPYDVLFDNETKKGLCVVDLDTVMPGSSLYDFGDSIRFGANTAAEDEKDLSKVSLNLDYFKAYVEGYLESAGKSLTENEIDYLPFSAKLLTLECGIRFLGDFINGDVYFKTEYPEHNLVRARTQFKLVEDIEAKFDEMKAIVNEAKKSI